MTSSLEQTNHNSSELSQQQLQQRKDFAARNQRIEDLIQEIYRADDTEHGALTTKKTALLNLAAEMEKVMLAHEQPEQVKEICSQICQRFQTDKRNELSAWVYRTLDEKYIRKLDESSIRSTALTVDLPVECSIAEKLMLADLDKLEKVDPFTIVGTGSQKVLDKLYKAVNKFEGHCDLVGLAYHNPHKPKSKTDEVNDNADKEYDAKISRKDAPIPEDEAIRLVDADAFEHTMAYAKLWEKWAIDQRDHYPSQTLEQATEWRDCIIADERIMEQNLDGKARRTIPQWAQINSNMAEHGGTAASSKSAMPVADSNRSNSKDGIVQLVDPKTLRPVFRDITKEQIDARGPKYASEIDFIIRQRPISNMRERRYIYIKSPFGEERAHAASPKLSRQA